MQGLSEDNNLHVGVRAMKNEKVPDVGSKKKGVNQSKKSKSRAHEDINPSETGPRQTYGHSRYRYRFSRYKVANAGQVVQVPYPEPNPNRTPSANSTDTEKVIHPQSVQVVRYSTIKM